jgi:hypothetical protein
VTSLSAAHYTHNVGLVLKLTQFDRVDVRCQDIRYNVTQAMKAPCCSFVKQMSVRNELLRSLIYLLAGRWKTQISLLPKVNCDHGMFVQEDARCRAGGGVGSGE